MDDEDARSSLDFDHGQEWEVWTWDAATKNESGVYEFYNVLCIEWDEAMSGARGSHTDAA